MSIKKIIFYGKTSDCFHMLIKNRDGFLIKEYEGYPPMFLGSDGDSLGLEIDIETGQILNWDAKKALKELQEIIEEEE